MSASVSDKFIAHAQWLIAIHTHHCLLLYTRYYNLFSSHCIFTFYARHRHFSFCTLHHVFRVCAQHHFCTWHPQYLYLVLFHNHSHSHGNVGRCIAGCRCYKALSWTREDMLLGTQKWNFPIHGQYILIRRHLCIGKGYLRLKSLLSIHIQGPPNLWQRTFWPGSRIKTKKKSKIYCSS